MKDKNMTKKQLINELAVIRQRVAELEKSEIERKQTQEALLETEEMFRLFMDLSPIYVFFKDENIRAIQVSKNYEKMLERPVYEIIGKTMDALFPSELAKSMIKDDLRILREGKPIEVIEELNGRFYKTTKFPIKREGKLSLLAGFTIDITESKEAEEALKRKSEEQVLLLDNIQTQIWYLKDYETHGMVNKALADFLGKRKQDLENKKMRDILPKEAAEICIAGNKEVFEKKIKIHTEERVMNAKGEERLLAFTKTPKLDERGNVEYVVCSAEDITEAKRAEEALRQSEEDARRLADEKVVMAEIGRIISSTLNIEDVYDGFAKEVHKLIEFDRFTINSIDLMNHTASIRYAPGFEVRNRRLGDVVSLVDTAAGEVVRTRTSLLIQGENQEAVLNRWPGLIPVIKSGLQSLMVVPLISKNEVIGTLNIQSLKENAYAETDLKKAEGVGNQIAGAIANALLFEEHMRAEEEKNALQEQLRQSQKMEAIGQLAGGIAHDFNNLLTIMRSHSQMALMELKEGDRFREAFIAIEKASTKSANLVRQILAFSRRQVMEMIVLDLNDLLRGLEKMLRRIIGEDIELLTFLADDLGRVRTDPGQIEQVVLNLAVNARDAMPSGGKLTIETANVELDEAYTRKHVAMTPGRYVMIAVSDTGKGMSMEVRDHVFEPFFTTKEKGKGTGLGLSMVYGIIKQSEGNIWVYSEPGQGTTFKIYLPRVDEALGEIKKRAEGDKLPLGWETILVVEDEEEVRKLAVLVLQKQGYRVLEAAQGGDALLICEQRKDPIHLMLTDVVMPRMSGRELAARLASLHPEMRVLYMSGYTDDAITHHSVLEEGLNFIQKPFTLDGLARKVREVLDKDPNPQVRKNGS